MEKQLSFSKHKMFSLKPRLF